MTALPKMTEAQAYQYLDFVGFRLFGWEIVDGMKFHPNSKAYKAIFNRFVEVAVKACPRPDVFVEAAMAGVPIHTLWPEDMQDEVERQINTKVPRACNEPTSPEFIFEMHEHGRTDWVLPEFLANHGEIAGVWK